MYNDYFVKFRCPTFTDPMVVLKDIQKLLLSYKCDMTECGELGALEKVVFRKATGAARGKALPPQYLKNVSDDFG